MRSTGQIAGEHIILFERLLPTHRDIVEVRYRLTDMLPTAEPYPPAEALR